MDDNPTPRRGRPRSSRAPDAVRAAAARLFAERGYSATSVRDIATAAGVDPALVIRHFGSKEALFLETMTVDQELRGIVDGPLETLGRSILERLVGEAGLSQRSIFVALIGALEREDVRRYLDESTERQIVQPLSARLSGDDAALRARLIATQVLGLLVSLWVLERPPAGIAMNAVLDRYADGLQALIDDRRDTR